MSTTIEQWTNHPSMVTLLDLSIRLTNQYHFISQFCEELPDNREIRALWAVLDDMMRQLHVLLARFMNRTCNEDSYAFNELDISHLKEIAWVDAQVRQGCFDEPWEENKRRMAMWKHSRSPVLARVDRAMEGWFIALNNWRHLYLDSYVIPKREPLIELGRITPPSACTNLQDRWFERDIWVTFSNYASLGLVVSFNIHGDPSKFTVQRMGHHRIMPLRCGRVLLRDAAQNYTYIQRIDQHVGQTQELPWSEHLQSSPDGSLILIHHIAYLCEQNNDETDEYVKKTSVSPQYSEQAHREKEPDQCFVPASETVIESGNRYLTHCIIDYSDALATVRWNRVYGTACQRMGLPITCKKCERVDFPNSQTRYRMFDARPPLLVLSRIVTEPNWQRKHEIRSWDHKLVCTPDLPRERNPGDPILRFCIGSRFFIDLFNNHFSVWSAHTGDFLHWLTPTYNSSNNYSHEWCVVRGGRLIYVTKQLYIAPPAPSSYPIRADIDTNLVPLLTYSDPEMRDSFKFQVDYEEAGYKQFTGKQSVIMWNADLTRVERAWAVNATQNKLHLEIVPDGRFAILHEHGLSIMNPDTGKEDWFSPQIRYQSIMTRCHDAGWTETIAFVTGTHKQVRLLFRILQSALPASCPKDVTIVILQLAILMNDVALFALDNE